MIFWIRLIAISVLTALHFSIVQVFSSMDVPPAVLIGGAIVWTVLLGFPRSLYQLFFLILVSESILFGKIEFFSVYFVLVAYTTSFIMKRTLVGDRTGLSFLILACFSMLANIGFVFFEEILYVLGHGGALSSVFQIFFLKTTYRAGLVGFFVYPVVFFILNSCEKMIRNIRQATQFTVR